MQTTYSHTMRTPYSHTVQTPTTFTGVSNLDGEMMRAKVLDVFELDRVLLLFVSGSNVWRNECRLVDVNVPVDDAPWSGRESGRNWLRAWLLDKKVWVECGKCDKYGRVFGVLYMDSNFATSVNAEAGAYYVNAEAYYTSTTLFKKQPPAHGPRAHQRHPQ